jgi:Cu(I)/Ag(I) efflux system membrane fusion protein
VPTEAVIQTGRRTVVIVAEDNGRFRPVDVEAGIESGGQTEIKRGLSAGQRVVVSSQFLIDSEASLKGVEARLNSEPSAAAAASPSAPMAASAPRHIGEAKVVGIGKDALTLSHGAIPTMKWGPMTMDFKLPPGGATSGATSGVQVGDRVRFEFFMGTDDLPQLTRVTPLAADAKAAPAAAPGGKP